MRSIFSLTLSLLLFSVALHADTTYSTSDGRQIRIHPVASWQDIDVAKSQKILVKSFMTGYEDVPLIELNPQFASIGDVRRFYEAYFFEEYDRFKKQEVLWIEAYVDDELAGWATFELETDEADAAYMVLLTVSPDFQGLGVGRQLTFSICSEELYPNIQAINLLVRKINRQGYQFYYKIGFFDYDYQRQDNFVDTRLLTGLRWQR